MKDNKKHYDEEYFKSGREIGELHILLNIESYRKHVKNDEVVLDFGCGGGFMLSKLAVKQKYGVEINSAARKEAKKNGVLVYPSIAELPDDISFDTIVSNHALEHCTRPLDELLKLYSKLKKGGKLVLFLPFEGLKRKYKPLDKAQHLYTWSPLNIGNLVTLAGFKVIDIETNMFIVPLAIYKIHRVIGRTLSYLVFKIIGIIFRNTLSEIRLTAIKE